MLTLLLVCSVTLTEGSPKKTFDEAEAAATAGRWTEAAQLFIESFGRRPHAHAAYNAAQSLLRSADLERALAWLDEAARAPGHESLPGLEEQRRALAAVVQEGHEAALLRVHSVPVGGRVWLDAGPIGHTPTAVRLEPGQHVVRIDVETETLLRTVSLSKGTTEELWAIPRRRGPASVIGAAVAAAGIATAGIGIGFGVSAQRNSQELRQSVHDGGTAQQLFDRARDHSLAANVLFAATLALMATGGWLLWFDGRAE